MYTHAGAEVMKLWNSVSYIPKLLCATLSVVRLIRSSATSPAIRSERDMQAGQSNHYMSTYVEIQLQKEWKKT